MKGLWKKQMYITLSFLLFFSFSSIPVIAREVEENPECINLDIKSTSYSSNDIIEIVNEEIDSVPTYTIGIPGNPICGCRNSSDPIIRRWTRYVAPSVNPMHTRQDYTVHQCRRCPNQYNMLGDTTNVGHLGLSGVNLGHMSGTNHLFGYTCFYRARIVFSIFQAAVSFFAS